MKYHSGLLQRFISLPVDAETFARDLTLKTCEIEDIMYRKIPDKVVIGKTTKVEKHPDADTLIVCQVDCGSAGQYQIITGGENIVVDVYVPVALPGCYLPVIDLSIAERKMRGLTSSGMICSKGELGIHEDEEKHRIWLLGNDFDDMSDKDLGKPLAEKYPWLESFVLDVDNKTVTHRPDLTGHFGLAVEAHTLYPKAKGTIGELMENSGKPVELSGKLQAEGRKQKAGKKIQVKTDKLLAYTLIELDDVVVQQSSFFTRLQLLDLGHTPKNNRVDFSNLFMYLTGQPIHFFDADTLVGDVMVRQANDGERFIDLTGGEHILLSADIVIADDDKVIALAGVIGGQSSAVSDSTKNIVVEIANFDPVQVRKTGTRLGLRTDAELRFEKYINPVRSLFSVALFRDCLTYYAKDLGLYTLGGSCVWYKEGLIPDIQQKKIGLDYGLIDSLLYGKKTDNHTLYKTILSHLGFVVKGNSVSVPVWRSPDDINIHADLVEEVARHIGYDSFPLATMKHNISHTTWVSDVALRRAIEEISKHDLHADQLETYPCVPEKVLDMFGVDKKSLYTINNPLAPEQRYLRDNLVYNLLSYTAKNSKFFDTFSVWDYGKVRSKSSEFRSQSSDESKKKSQYAKDFVGEKNGWGMMIYAKNISSRNNDTLLEAKSAVAHVVQQLGCNGAITFVPDNNPRYHPKKQATIVCNNTIIGFVGSIHPLVLVDCKMPEQAQVTYLSLDCDVVQSTIQTSYHASFQTLQDQIVTRDLCFVIDTALPWSLVTDAVAGIENVIDVTVFDLYVGEKLGDGKKSIALTMTIRGDNLRTEDINSIMDNAILSVKKVGGELRK